MSLLEFEICNNTHMITWSSDDIVLLYHRYIFSLLCKVRSWNFTYNFCVYTTPVLVSLLIWWIHLSDYFINSSRLLLFQRFWLSPIRGIRKFVHYVFPSEICHNLFFLWRNLCIEIKITNNDSPVFDFTLCSIEHIKSGFHLSLSSSSHF